MRARKQECYDATKDIVNHILNIMDEFYATHPDREDHFLLFFKQIIREVIVGWKKRMKQRHPYNFNEELSNCTDVSKRQIERIPLKN